MARFFSEKETENLSPDLVHKLDKAREYCNFPIIITSGYRSQEENAKIGSQPTSAHTKGLAADLRRPNGPDEAMQLAWALGLAGLSRFEVCDRHVHVDIDPSKPSPVTWKGISK